MRSATPGFAIGNAVSSVARNVTGRVKGLLRVLTGRRRVQRDADPSPAKGPPSVSAPGTVKKTSPAGAVIPEEAAAFEPLDRNDARLAPGESNGVKKKRVKKKTPAGSTTTSSMTTTHSKENGAAAGAEKAEKTMEKAKKEEKGAVGYHYWHEQANQGTAPKAAPKKLTDEEAKMLAKEVEGTGTGLSSWNKAGGRGDQSTTKRD